MSATPTNDDHDGSASTSLLSPAAATAYSILYTLLYVGVIYLSPITRPRRGLDRSSTFVIQARVRGVTVVTMLCVAITSAVVHYSRSPSSWWSTLEFMAIAHITPRTAWDILKALLLTAVLFLGPMLEQICTGSVGTGEGFANGRLTWIGWRNYVVAPLTEEIVFRACMVPLYLIAGVSPSAIVFLTPLVFGIAHFHHAYEYLLNFPGHYKIAMLSSIPQFMYTTLFGWFAVFVMMRTGSVWAAVVVHTYCNYMGLPSLTVDGPRGVLLAYWVSLVGGAWGFYRLFWTMTESPNAMAVFT
ncbi:hypothetical protein BZA05DRAFT_251012 [Tricharina praecox]|uniref:uncharacterized protein n=1 Tax=Tricharina praecox TaxID=43433 RepID=UPI0022205679|nr:uncharacterized protein BZA05DRAFT_251012 [Tricharina praecox]KAI5854817.1 hypothetical protein BZA05DRAFT_251012 [Tricharina praecox]